METIYELGNKLRELEKIAGKLEPDKEKREKLTSSVMKYANEFLEKIYERKAYETEGIAGGSRKPFSIDGKEDNIENIIEIIREYVDKPGLNPASGGHLGYIPGGGIFPSALGDFLAAVTNRYAGVFFGGPGAVRLENEMINWMKEIMGFPSSTGGNITSGGSIANLIGIVAARDTHLGSPSEYEKAVIYLSGQRHHSIDKALRIAGLGMSRITEIPMDENFRMRSDLLEKAILEDVNEGRTPFLVIASAGTTDTGSVDPLPEIASICRSNSVWLHVDAAYGGFFILTDEGKKQLKGIELADSLVMDPHKGLFLPYGIGAVLVRDKKSMFKSHFYQANYMQDTFDANEETSPADISPELTKHFRGLRMWLPLKLFGIEPFRAALEEKIMLTRYFYRSLEKEANFQTGPYPQLSVMIFRYIPNNGDPDEFNMELVKQIRKDGRVFLSSTTIDGNYFIRLAVLSFRTHKKTIDLTIQLLKENAKTMEKNDPRFK